MYVICSGWSVDGVGVKCPSLLLSGGKVNQGISQTGGPRPFSLERASHIKASQLHFLYFPCFGVRIFHISAFLLLWNLLRPLFSGLRGTFRIFRIMAVLGSNLAEDQKTREGCGCPKVLAGMAFQQTSTLLVNYSLVIRRDEMPSLPRFRQWLLEIWPRLRERSWISPPRPPQPS